MHDIPDVTRDDSTRDPQQQEIQALGKCAACGSELYHGDDAVLIDGKLIGEECIRDYCMDNYKVDLEGEENESI
ncbi:MAG: hypothetical protein LBS74_02985 [Oscillospiraceae bacterium]|jgi:hypothetical protein|nr:hypothetical protein [Oscillospiraceae bacterium]